MNTKPIIALLYDFDKTLCTTDMEDYAFIPALGYTPAQFWHRANTYIITPYSVDIMGDLIDELENNGLYL